MSFMVPRMFLRRTSIDCRKLGNARRPISESAAFCFSRATDASRSASFLSRSAFISSNVPRRRFRSSTLKRFRRRSVSRRFIASHPSSQPLQDVAELRKSCVKVRAFVLLLNEEGFELRVKAHRLVDFGIRARAIGAETDQ